jgi:hypothetical protein
MGSPHAAPSDAGPARQQRGAARLGLAGIALSALGQALLWRQGLPVPTVLPRFGWGVGLLVAGLVAFAVASRKLTQPPALTQPAVPPAPEEASGDPWPFAFGLAPALALSFLNAMIWIANGESPWTRWVWLASVALLLWPARGDRIAWRRPPATLALALGVVMVAAFALRAWDRAQLPLALHGDMAEMGLGGRELLHGRVTTFVSVGWASIPWVGFLPAALGLAASDDLSGLRLSSAVLGTAAVAGVYLLGTLLFGRRIALLAAAASAIGYAEIHFSRLPAYGDPVPFLVFGLYFLLQGLRTGERLSFVSAGVLAATSCLLYYSGRVAPLLAGLVLAHAALVEPALLRRRWRGLAAGALAALVTLGPMLLFYAERPGELTARQHDVSLFTPHVAGHLKNAYGVTSIAQVMARQGARSALLFHHTPDTSLQFGFPRPMLSPFLAPLAALGLAACLARLRSPGSALLAGWWVLVVLGASTFTSDAPFWPRLVVVLPAAALLVAVGYDRALDALAALRTAPRIEGRARLLAAAPLLAAVAAVNWSWYVTRARAHVDVAEWLGRQIAREPSVPFCMVPGLLSFREEEIRFLAPRHDLREVAAEDLAACVAERRVIVVYPHEHPAVLEAVRALEPGAREVAHDLPNGMPGPLFVYPR